jgi:biotin-(acetyl-CoA carboxylase) ligase
MEQGRRRNGRGWAWALVALLALIVVVETVVLAVLASLVSFAVAIALVLAVIAVGLLIVRDVRRHWVQPPAESTSWDELVA